MLILLGFLFLVFASQTVLACFRLIHLGSKLGSGNLSYFLAEKQRLKEQLKARIAESAIKVSTVKAPHTYMKAVGTRELEKILEEVFSDKIHGTN